MSETRDNEIKKFVRNKFKEFLYKETPIKKEDHLTMDNLCSGYLKGYMDCINAVQKVSRLEGTDILDILLTLQSSAFELSEQKNESKNDQK